MSVGESKCYAMGRSEVKAVRSSRGVGGCAGGTALGGSLLLVCVLALQLGWTLR